MQDQSHKQPENKTRSSETAASKKQGGGLLTQRFIDNRPEAAVQRQLITDAASSGQSNQAAQLQAMADRHAAGKPIQLMRAGVIPKAPDSYRTTTRVADNNSFAAIDGHKSFNDSQKTKVRTDNETLSGDAYVKKENHPLQDDDDNSGLLTQDRSSEIAPEVDHIVPIDDNGANDVRNARVLSKSNNINSTNRPGEGARTVAVYESVQIGMTDYDAGDSLSDYHITNMKKKYAASSKQNLVAKLDSKTTGDVESDF